MNETRSGVNDRPRPSVVSRSSRRQLPTVTSSSGTEPEGRGWSDKRRMWEGAWKERECSVAKGPDRHAPSHMTYISYSTRGISFMNYLISYQDRTITLYIPGPFYNLVPPTY